MFKIYKRTIHIDTPEQLRKRGSVDYMLGERSNSSAVSNLLTIPAMIAGAVVGALVFSMFFALLMIPLGIVGFKAWRNMKRARQQSFEQSIEAEYTVVSAPEKK